MVESSNYLDGLKLVALFAVPPNLIGLCGEKNAAANLYSYLETENIKGVKTVINTFPALSPYLHKIASINGIEDPFSPQVIKSYILGSNMHVQPTLEDFNILKEEIMRKKGGNYTIRDWPQEKPVIFNHNCHVLLTASGLTGIAHCLVLGGKVEAVKEGLAVVVLKSVQLEEGNFCNLAEDTQDLRFNPKYVNLQPGNLVATHWGSIITVLTAEEYCVLNKTTEEALTMFS